MDTDELDRLIGELAKLEQREADPDLRAELSGIRERMVGLRQSPLVSDSARGVVTPEARRALGIDAHGFVESPETIQAAIKSMEESFKTAFMRHDTKLQEVHDFLATVWADPKLKTKGLDSQHALALLETTRRFLIAIKKYLAQHNARRVDGEREFRLADERAFKAVYYGLLAKARVHEHTIKRSGFHRNIHTTRVYYDTSEQPLVSDLDQRWSTMWDPDSPDLRRIHQHNVSSGDTIDYLPRAEEIVLLFYPRDVRERWAFSGKRAKPTREELTAQLERTGFKLSKTRAANKKGDFKSKDKFERSEQLLSNMLALAGTSTPLAPTGQRRGEHALLNRTLSLYIRDARVHISELLATYESKYTVSEYVGRVKSLDKDISDVARRIAEWSARHDTLHEQIAPMWELAEQRESIEDDQEYKLRLFSTLRAHINKFPGSSVWDMAYVEVRESEADDSSDAPKRFSTELASWRKAYEADLVELFGAEQAKRLPKDIPALEVVCMGLFHTHMPDPPKGVERMSAAKFYARWKEGQFELDVANRDLQMSYDVDWDAMVRAMPRDECEHLHDIAIRVWEVEMFELQECIGWAEGNREERRTAKWIEHGNAIADYIARSKGVIAFVDTHEACFDKMEDFISWVLFPKHDFGRDRNYEQLTVGSGVVNFQVNISLGASAFSRIEGKVTLAYQYSGKIAQDDDRRVRWTGKHSFNLSANVDAKLGLSDIADVQSSLDVLKASVSASKELYSAVSVSVYESPRHLAAVWAEDLANARYLLTTPVNGISTPGGFKRFRGVPSSETEREILEQVVGGSAKLQELSALLQRPRTRAKRSGWRDYESDVALAAELELPLLRGKAERLVHAMTRMHFSRRIMSELDQPKEDYAGPPITHTWSKNLYAFPFPFPLSPSPVTIDSKALEFSMLEEVDAVDNPLDLWPEESSDPPTKELLGGAFEADNGSFDVGFTHIFHHPNPDNDGMYLNLKSSRNWGLGVRTEVVNVGVQRTQQWVPIDRNKLRHHFNYMIECCREFFADYKNEDGGRALPELGSDPDEDATDPGREVSKEELNDLIVGHIRRHQLERIRTRSWFEGQPLLHSRPGSSMLRRLHAMSLFGAFELNFIYNKDSGFEVQYGRVWVTTKILVGGSGPILPFLTIGAELAAETSHCCYETLGLYTLSYILTVYNGCRKRHDPDGERAEWKAWVHEHREELHALFNKIGDPSCNTHAEVEKDAGAQGKLGVAATDLLELCNVEVDAHLPAVLGKGPAKTRSGKVALSPSHSSKPVVLGGASFGPISLRLKCHTGWHDSIRWYRRGPRPHTRDERRRGKPISSSTHPMFILRPANPYEIEFTIENPKRVKLLELDVLDQTGASALSEPWVIDASILPALFDPSKPSAAQKVARYKSRLIWYGSKAGRIAKGKIARLAERELDGVAALPPNKAGGYYCMVLSVKEATVGPPAGAVAWTYFAVLDDPIAKLEDYLQAAGEAQDAERKPSWTKRDAPSRESDSDEPRQAKPSSDEPSSAKPDASAIPKATPGRESGKAKPPKITPSKPKPRDPPPAVPPTPELIMGIENLGAARGYTCYLNSALQLIIHAGLLPDSRDTSGMRDATTAQALLDFADAYERKRLSGAPFWPKEELDILVDLRARLVEIEAITQATQEDDAAAVLFELLQACASQRGVARPSPVHFELRVTKTYQPGPGRRLSDEQLVQVKRDVVELGADDTTFQIQSHNHLQLDELPSATTTLEALWAANWDAEVDDEPSRKYRGKTLYPEARPTHQTITFEGNQPNPLMVLLKRFDRTGRKIETPIAVDPRPTFHGQRYRLSGFIEHIGSKISTGHYVVYLHRHGTWWRCSDDSVLAISDARIEARIAQGYIFCFQQEA